MNRIISVVIILLSVTEAFAQKRFFIKADSLVAAFYNNSGFDTSFVSRPTQRFMFAVHPDFSSIGVSIGKQNQHADFDTDLSDNIGAFATYWGYGFGYSFKPRRGRKNDNEFNFRFFCRRFGIETDFTRATSFSSTLTDGDTVITIDRGDIDFKMRMLTFYYVFNNRRFAFPAAFDKSYTQIRSAGSPLLGFSYVYAKMNTSKYDFDILSRNAGLGCGYGYNFVVKQRLLMHLSLISTFVFWEDNKVYTPQGYNDMSYKITDIGLYARAAVSYNFDRLFLGWDSVWYATLLGSRGNVTADYSRTISRLFLGFWF